MQPAVLFVCLGNICRSPLAEAALRRAAQQAGLDIRIDSAGTGDWHLGKAPDPRAIATARRHGCDITQYRARQLCAADFDQFTHIFALDASNLSAVRKSAPRGSTAKVSLLLDMVAGRKGESVADPYFGDEEGFETAWADVVQGAQALVERMQAA
jgi:protein-tyrosine phosphatase